MLRRALKNILKSVLIERILKADERAFNALLSNLEKALKETSDAIFQDILKTTIDILRRTDDLGEAVDYLKKYSESLGADAREAVGAKIADLTEKLYKVGASSVLKEAGADIGFKFGLKDLDAMEIIGEKNLFWIGEHYDGEVKEKFDALLQDFFEHAYSRADFAAKVQDAMQPWMEEEAQYWEGLADHIATKTKELGRVAGYKRAGIEYVKVKAILDGKTSEICRCMNGRIISIRQIREQADNIMAATTKEEMKAAQAWIPSFNGKTSDLPSGVAGPPYHYK